MILPFSPLWHVSCGTRGRGFALEKLVTPALREVALPRKKGITTLRFPLLRTQNLLRRFWPFCINILTARPMTMTMSENHPGKRQGWQNANQTYGFWLGKISDSNARIGHGQPLVRYGNHQKDDSKAEPVC